MKLNFMVKHEGGFQHSDLYNNWQSLRGYCLFRLEFNEDSGHELPDAFGESVEDKLDFHPEKTYHHTPPVFVMLLDDLSATVTIAPVVFKAGSDLLEMDLLEYNKKVRHGGLPLYTLPLEDIKAVTVCNYNARNAIDKKRSA